MKNLKKLCSLFAIVALFAAEKASAQATNQYVQMKAIVGTTDTVTNTGIGYDTIQIHGSYRTGVVVVQVAKVSGTVSPTILVLASVNGLSWFTYGQDTNVLSNVSGTGNYYTVNLNGRLTYSAHGVADQLPAILPYQYYKVQVTGTGTMKAWIKSWILVRP